MNPEKLRETSTRGFSPLMLATWREKSHARGGGKGLKADFEWFFLVLLCFFFLFSLNTLVWDWEGQGCSLVLWVSWCFFVFLYVLLVFFVVFW